MLSQVTRISVPDPPNFKPSFHKQESVQGNYKLIERRWLPEVDKLFQFIPTTDQIQASKQTVNDILDIIADECLAKHKGIIDIVALYLSTDWVWKTNLGSLPKRISKWYHTHHKDNLSETTLTQIGNLFRKETPKTQKYIFDITKTFDWKDGDFADGGSCFWGSNARARTKMQNTEGYYAIRLFKPSETPHPVLKTGNFSTKDFQKLLKYENKHYPTKCMENERLEYFNTYMGYARAWLYTDVWEASVGNLTFKYPIVIIFNGYGVQTNLIASIFAEAMQLPVRRLTINNGGAFSGYLYVNDTGYVIGDPKVTDQVEVFDFDLKFN